MRVVRTTLLISNRCWSLYYRMVADSNAVTGSRTAEIYCGGMTRGVVGTAYGDSAGAVGEKR